MNEFLYYLKEGFSKVFSKRGNVTGTAASVCITAAVLAIAGIFVSVGANVAGFADRLGSSAEINVYISNDLGGRSIEDIENDLKHIGGVAGVRFYSRNDRLEKVSREVYGDDGYVFEQGENPLRDSYIITAGDISELPEIAEKARNTDGVEEVVENSDTINGIQMFVSAMKKAGIWLMIILAALAVFIVSNSIRMKLTSNAEEIRIMKIVGAADSFIAIPYIIQGMITGLLGALFGASATVIGYVFLVSKLEAAVPGGLVQFVSAGKIAAAAVPVFVLFGIMVGALGSGFALHRYFKR